jgi:hypothetical protein
MRMNRYEIKFQTFILCCAAIACLLLAPLATHAQSLERGAIHGTVTDKSHAVVPGAKVTLTNPSTGIHRELTAGTSGDYDFEAVPPGEYTIVAESAGFAVTTTKGIQLPIGSSITIDIEMPLKAQATTVEVTASGQVVDTSTAGITQLLDSRSVENLPFPGRDYRDLAQLSPTASVVPGLRGGLRLGGQQSDYSGLVVDGMDTTNNFFGENFGSLETKNLTIPLEAVQEFQVVTNGFAPEFGRATGGLLNVVTKSGTNELHGEAHEYYRGGGLTANDALHTPSNINRQNQFGGSVGFPIHKDRQFLFLSTDIQRENGPLTTVFCPPGSGNAACEATLQDAGPVILPPVAGSNEVLPVACGGSAAIGQNLLPACYGVPNLAAFEGAHTQFQNFFTLLGHYDYQINNANHFSIRGFGTRNHTSGFTGGQGQSETFDAIGNAENFVNQGISGVFSLTTVLGRKVNEVRVGIEGETRKRHPIDDGAPQIQILGIGNFGQRFYLPGNNDNGKLQVSDNFSYTFGKHDMKFGGDVDSFVDRKDIFAGWSAGEYTFNSLCDFDPNPLTCSGVATPPTGPNPSFFEQGFGLNGVDVFAANTLKPAYQTGVGLYAQDKWQVTPHVTLTYGLRWDGTRNPAIQTPVAGSMALVGQGSGSHVVPMPQGVPNDYSQWGPRVGIAWNAFGTEHPTVFRAAYGVYYAQTPTIFFPTIGGARNATLFCPPVFGCTPPQDTPLGTPPNFGGFPYLFPSALPFGVGGLCASAEGCPSPTYVDPSFKNPKVQNLTVGVETTIAKNWIISLNYAFVHSDNLRVGGFSTTIWNRNVVSVGTDQFGRTELGGTPVNGGAQLNGANGGFNELTPLDPTQFSNTALASFGHGNYHEVIAGVNRRFANRFQLFANYTWSRNFGNGSSERDTDTFFGPQDPINLNLDYGRDGLDIEQQFKAGGVINLPWGFTWSNNFIAHSGLAYPAYIAVDLNGDGTSNQGFGSNDRPPVQLGSGKPFLMPDYPGRQPNYFNWDTRISKDFNIGERYQIRLSADLFNLTNASNLYSNPDHSAFVDFPTAGCTYFPNSVSLNCPPLTALPKPGDISLTNGGTKYRTLDELAPGATPFAAQFGIRFQF